MAADQRLVSAREFLDAIRPYKVTSRPPSVLVREDAELRRMLGQVLDVIRESVSLTDDHLVTLSLALTDAIDWRTPAMACSNCDATESGLCSDHAGDVALVDRYLALARELGIEVNCR